MRLSVISIIALAELLLPGLGWAQDGILLDRLPAITPQDAHFQPLPTAQDAQSTPITPTIRELAQDTQRDVTLAGVQDDQSWYEWITPNHWDLPSHWEASLEIGLAGTDGNTQTFTFRGGAELKRKVEWSDLRVDINYVRGSANSIETKHDAQLDVVHDWLLGDGPWSLFGKMQLEYDEFKAFDVRLVLNTGVGYRFIDNGVTMLKGRVGAGTSREFNGPDDRWAPEAMFGLDFEHQLSKRQKLRVTVDYFPDWENFTDYRLRTDVGWQVLLDEATNMSLKLGILDRYDSTPNGRRPNDLDYSLLLLWEL